MVLQDHRPPNFAINLPAMTLTQEDTSVPIFEIDQTETYGRYLISNPLEILLNLRALAKQRTIITLYLDDGSQFF